MSKVTPGWRHAFRGDFGHVKQVQVRVTASIHVQTCMRIYNDVPIPAHIPDFSKCTKSNAHSLIFVFKLL